MIIRCVISREIVIIYGIICRPNHIWSSYTDFKSYMDIDFKSYTVHIWSYVGGIWSCSLKIYDTIYDLKSVICRKSYMVVQTIYDLSSNHIWSTNHMWGHIWDHIHTCTEPGFHANHIWYHIWSLFQIIYRQIIYRTVLKSYTANHIPSNHIWL